MWAPALALVAACLGCSQEVDPTVKDTPITIVHEVEGVGQPAKNGDLCTINYRLLTEDGREVLSEDGYLFILGTGAVIAGIDDAVRGMRITGERQIKCPPHRHWGRDGYGDELVPANATLTIFVELEAID